ncbi:hypothetical protein [Sinorhizobium saheli]|uniref:Tail fiber protein n=1 Tax=Sinorhizobium saheli TaxID=36856 RepID=A0A178XGI4_SINSA|nr:hypothetical protein [Sinorhizobium saheli]MQW85765.1 hypothetical protein [Sinorhizobium saheli]OAP34348.1 hypothetical protein ATB98_22575 [Sinorhizobium saheli]
MEATLPRTGGVYSPPAGTKGVPNTTIQSVPYNALIDDLTADANAARPITAGGTGATSASAARAALGAQASSAALTSIAGLVTSADKMIYTTAADAYATTALTPFVRTLLDDATAAAALTTLGVSAFAQTVLDDADAATARATLGANNASNLTTGTIPNTRVSGVYDQFTQVRASSDGEAFSLLGSATGDPFIAFWKASDRKGYIQHRDGTANGDGIRVANDDTGDYLYVSNVNSIDALKFYDSSVAAHNTVWHSGNLAASDINTLYGYTPASNAVQVAAGNGLTGGGAISATRTLTLGTPSDITNSTTNSVTATSHTHALGFIAAEVYTGTSATNTNYPVGTYILAQDAGTNRNASSPVYYNSGDSIRFNTVSGTALSGTWRARGYEDQSGARATLFQRTA